MTDWRVLLVDDDSGLAAIFRESKTVAVLGAKADSAEPAYYVPAYLRSRGYRIRPVNPRFVGRRLHDAETVASLRDLAEATDVIEILRGIWLSFFHGAKIGVLGANGAGKSSLLRIMAGVDRDFLGEAFAAAGLRIGYLPQEPQLDPAKDVRGNVEEGVAEVRALLTRFEEVSAKLGEPIEADEMEKLLDEQARLQDRSDAVNAWDLDRTVELAMDALRVPPGDMDVTRVSGGERRRVALCRLLTARPDMLLLDEPTNHLDAESVAWLERYLD